MNRIKGYCPFGCGETLFVGDGGYITCCFLKCPNPCGVSEILENKQTEHRVIFDDDGFKILHPLRERINEELFDCKLMLYCNSLSGPPRKSGEYMAFMNKEKNEWNFIEIDNDLTSRP